jgi:hypothetical protein
MKRKYKLTIEKGKLYHYNKSTSIKEVTKMSAIIADRIRRLNLTPQQKENLKINDKDIEKSISGDFVQKVVTVVDKYKNVIQELSKY